MLSTIITYGLLLLHYTLFFLAVKTTHESGGGHLRQILSGKAEPGILFTRMIAGIFFLGLGTAIVTARSSFDFSVFVPAMNKPVWLWIGLAIIAVILGWIAGKKENTSDHYSHILPPYLPFSHLAVRTLYLIIYEFFFRGTMLFIMVNDFGIIAAVSVNLFLYTLSHWYDERERYGSLITGIAFCTLSLYYHSVWPAVFVHLALSLTYESTLLANHHSSTKKIRL